MSDGRSIEQQPRGFRCDMCHVIYDTVRKYRLHTRDTSINEAGVVVRSCCVTGPPLVCLCPISRITLLKLRSTVRVYNWGCPSRISSRNLTPFLASDHKWSGARELGFRLFGLIRAKDLSVHNCLFASRNLMTMNIVPVTHLANPMLM